MPPNRATEGKRNDGNGVELTVRILEILLDVPLLFSSIGLVEILPPKLLRRGLD